ncbi:uncharacterized protein [Antedon mediterranea]|uniref:uncharacterized protein isoform X2 n=1 Tax=Antedon mediterranea TaxID=105859 RepID=UPI003AF9CC75
MANIDFEYKEFSAEFGRSFQGDNLKKLKFLLSDYISSTVLGKNSVTAIELLDDLAKHREQNEVIASFNALKLFSEIGELTKLGSLQDLLTEVTVPKPKFVHKGVGLKPYRSLFFNGIEQADPSKDFNEARAFYDQTHNSDIKDLWDLALYLQVNDFLVTRKDLNRFADRLSGKAKGIIKDGLNNLVFRRDEVVVTVKDADIKRDDKDKLVDLLPAKKDKESETREEQARINALPFKKNPKTQQGLERPKYTMSSKPGICLIINNYVFNQESELSERPGSKIDEGFVVEVKSNQTAQEMKDVMCEMSKREQHKTYDCFVCFILSHGRLGIVYGSDGKSCKIVELTNNFRKDKCTNLISKPKLFFIQACRPQNSGEDGVEPIPSDPDFLFGYSTPPLTKSVRNTDKGTHFIINLTKVLEERHHKDHILDILTIVNDQVNKVTRTRVPAPQYTLTKDLYFSSVDQ